MCVLHQLLLELFVSPGRKSYTKLLSLRYDIYCRALGNWDSYGVARQDKAARYLVQYCITCLQRGNAAENETALGERNQLNSVPSNLTRLIKLTSLYNTLWLPLLQQEGLYCLCPGYRGYQLLSSSLCVGSMLTL